MDRLVKNYETVAPCEQQEDNLQWVMAAATAAAAVCTIDPDMVTERG